MNIPVTEDEQYSIILVNLPPKAKGRSKNSRGSKKPTQQNRQGRSYSSKKNKKKKIEPKGFSRHDRKNQTKR